MHKTFWLAHMLWIVIYSQMILSNDLFCWLRNSSKGVEFTVLICLESGKQSKLHVYGAKTYFTSEMGWYSTLLLFWWQHYHQTWLPAILYSKPVHWPQVSAVAKCVRMLTIDVPELVAPVMQVDNHPCSSWLDQKQLTRFSCSIDGDADTMTCIRFWLRLVQSTTW